MDHRSGLEFLERRKISFLYGIRAPYLPASTLVATSSVLLWQKRLKKIT